MEASGTKEVQELYNNLIEAWNDRNARAMADLYTDDAEIIGIYGDLSIGRNEIFSHLNQIFEANLTAKFVIKIQKLSFLSSDIVLIRSILGMIPPGYSDITPKGNTHHTLVLVKQNGTWKIKQVQSTPAKFHTRPELGEKMTEELRSLL